MAGQTCLVTAMPVPRFAERNVYIGRCLCHSVLCSKACANWRMRASSRALPIICNPIGSDDPSGVFAKPQGMLIAQIPARLAGFVKISARYIRNGSAGRSPILKAGSGVVGEISASTFSKATGFAPDSPRQLAPSRVPRPACFFKRTLHEIRCPAGREFARSSPRKAKTL